MNTEITVGYALTGSFCTFEKTIGQIKNLVDKGFRVVPLMSFNAYNINTRFGSAESFIERIESLTGNKIIATLEGAEPLGPKKITDILIVSPCTGNTISKLKNGIYDTPVTLAVKSHLRNQRPVLIGISSNDSLTTTAKSIGGLMNYKNYYFIPFAQDDCNNKPFSVVCRFEKTYDAMLEALNGRQLQPMLVNAE